MELITKKYIDEHLSELYKEDEDVEFESTVPCFGVTTTYIFDNNDGKEIAFACPEEMTKKWLKEKIHVQTKIPVGKIDLDGIVDILFDNADKNLFVTLEDIWIVWDDEGLSEIENATGDEYANYIINEDMVGVMWFQRNSIVINLQAIYNIANEIAYDEYSIEREVSIGLICTIVHELRHLMLDTNIILSEEDYPVSESAEEKVENYGREFCDKNYCSTIFSMEL